VIDTGCAYWFTGPMAQTPAATTDPPTLTVPTTYLFKLVESHLPTGFTADGPTGSPLLNYVLTQRGKLVSSSYRKIANDLVALTTVDITHEAVRRWHRSACAGLNPPAAR
jgi:hypothetical protein